MRRSYLNLNKEGSNYVENLWSMQFMISKPINNPIIWQYKGITLRNIEGIQW